MTLIELILSMVIIALVFTVIPKMIAVTAKSSEQGKKEDALFNAVSALAAISYLPWDENDTLPNSNTSINNVDSNDFNCTLKNNRYRVGSFIDNGRKCNGETVSNIGHDNNDHNYIGKFADDVDDLDGSDNEHLLDSLGYICRGYIPDYNMTASICFVNDFNINEFANNGVVEINLSNECNNTGTTNIKLVKIEVRRADTSSKKSLGRCIASFYYHAFNLGISNEIPSRVTQ